MDTGKTCKLRTQMSRLRFKTGTPCCEATAPPIYIYNPINSITCLIFLRVFYFCIARSCCCPPSFFLLTNVEVEVKLEMFDIFFVLNVNTFFTLREVFLLHPVHPLIKE